MRGKHLETRQHLGERHRTVAPPLLVVLDAVQEDEEVLVVAAVVDLYVVDVAASHVCEFCEVDLVGLSKGKSECVAGLDWIAIPVREW